MFTLNLEVDEWVARLSGRVLEHGPDRTTVVHEMRRRYRDTLLSEEAVAAFDEVFSLPEPEQS